MRRLNLPVLLLTTLAVAVPAVQFASQPAALATVPGSVSAQAASSWQSNATVWKMAYGHGDVWMIGDFTSLRPPGDALGTGEQPANYFAALKASTGAPDASVDDTHTFTGQASGLPLTNGIVATSPDGNTVYVGGGFTTVDGVARNHIAAFSASTGALLSWNPNVSGSVSGIATYGNIVYISGAFSKVNKVARTNLAAVSATDASVLSWGSGTQPFTNNTVDALAVSASGTQVIAGGYFDQADGLTQSPDGTTPYNKAIMIGGIGSASAGLLEALPADGVVPIGTDAVNDGCTSDVKDIVVAGPDVYFADEGTGGGCFDGTWAAQLSDGSLKWENQCLGATQTIEVVGNYLYKGSHAHDCQSRNTNGDPDNFPQVPENQARHLLSQNVSDGFLGPWYPFSNAGPNLGPRAMTTDGSQLYVGGDFTVMNHVGQQGIARFTPTGDYPTPKPLAPIAVSAGSGRINVFAQPPVDLDDPDLTMELFRDSGTTPIASTTVHSLFWKQPTVGWTDSGLTPGSSHTYKVEAVETDGTGSSPLSVASVKVAAALTSNYAATVLSQDPVAYWRLGEPSGTFAADSSPGLQGGVYGGTVTLKQTGAIVGDSDTAAAFDGSTSTLYSGVEEPSPSTFSVDAWFKTTTTSGGKIIGFGNQQVGDSSNYDKQIYMTDSGQLIFGTNGAGFGLAQSSKSYNDGAWHQVVGTQGPTGMALYVDGRKVAGSPASSNQDFDGYWRIGGDNLNGWPTQPSSEYFAGTIDDVSVYPAALTTTEVDAQYTAAGYSVTGYPGSTSPYAQEVLGNGPSLYWRLDESSGATATDISGNDDNGTYGAGDTLGAAGAITDGTSPADTAVTTSGADNGVIVASSHLPSPSTYSLEAWINTTHAGGKIIGFGNSAAATGSSDDDHAVYFNSDGSLNFGIWNGVKDVIAAPPSLHLANGAWHHVVATQDGSGMKLYVDGALVASNSVTTSQHYDGYWHVGGDTGWSDDGNDFTGSLDEVAVYPYALSASEVSSDYRIGSGQQVGLVAPPAPATPTGSSASSSSVDLTWNTVGGATSYRVQRSVSGANSFADVGSPVSGTTLHDSALAAGASYDYRVVAINSTGSSSPSGVATVVVIPAGLGALAATSASSSEVDLSWGAAAGATAYDVRRGSVGAGTFPTDLGTTATTSYADTALAPGASFDYEVIPRDAGGDGTAGVVSGATLPATVTGLTATAVSAAEVDLTWSAAAGANSYRVERAPAGSGTWASVSTGSAATSFNDTSVGSGIGYDYRVAAVGAAGTGAYSATTTVTTPLTPPGKVTGLAATVTGPTEVDLSWAATTRAATYEVDRSTVSASAGFVPLASAVTSTSYADKTALAHTTYWYIVTAANTSGPGAASSAVTATTPLLNPPLVSNSFEGGTAGTAITAANSGGGSGSKFNAVSCTGGTVKYSATAKHGARGATLTPSKSPCYLQWAGTSIPTGTTTSYGRVYINLSANPGSIVVLAKLGNSSFARDAQIDLTTAGKISLYDANNTKLTTFTSSLPLHGWVRIEWSLVNSPSSGSLRVSLYGGDSTTAQETHTLTGINTGTGFGALQLGSVVTTTTAPAPFTLDDVAIGRTGPLGPAS